MSDCKHRWADSPSDAGEGIYCIRCGEMVNVSSLKKQIAELKQANEMLSKRVDWTVADNAKKAIQIAELVELLEDIKRKLEDGQYWSPEMLKDELAEAINKHKGE